MPTLLFDRDTMARWYAHAHLKTDPGIVAVHYLPHNAGEREIRFVDVNDLIGERFGSSLEPIDFGMETGTETAHRLLVLDVTSEEWERIETGTLQLPRGWSLVDAVVYQIPQGISVEQFVDQLDE